MRIAIDTNILVKAFREQETDYLQLVTSMDNSKQVCHDYRQRIRKEYIDRLEDLPGFWKWYHRLEQLQAIYYCSGDLPQKHRSALTELGCHEPPDHVFIAVALNSDKILFTEDSDMGKGPKGNEPPHDRALDYLVTTMGLTVCDVREALELLKG